MGFILKNKKIRFKKADYNEESGIYINPGRGWYHIYTFLVGETTDDELAWLPFEEGESIALVLLNIQRYSGREIDEEGLLCVEKILTVFERAQKEVILRILYDNEGKGMEKEPSLFSVIVKHMEQLGQIVKRHQKNIMLTQGLFIGSWGEMHGSKFLSKKQIRELTDVWKRACVRMAFRRPAQCRQAQGEKEGKCEIGIFDDAIFASENHLGTFGQQPRSIAGWEQPWCMEEELSYIRQSARIVPFGGEAVAGQELSPEDTVRELQKMNVSYLNSVYDEKILNRWREQQWNGERLYDYIGNHLGYRFCVRDASIVRRQRCINILLENTGFAALCDKADIRLMIERKKEGGNNEINRKVLPVSFDIRALQPKEKKEIKAELEEEIWKELKKGDSIFLQIIRSRDQKSIRLANQSAGERMLLGEIE